MPPMAPATGAADDARVGEFADGDFAFDFKSDDEEEEHHGAFVDPEVEGAVNGPEGELDAEGGAEQSFVFGVPGRVGPYQGGSGGGHQEEGAGAFGLDELLDRANEEDQALSGKSGARIEPVDDVAEHRSTVRRGSSRYRALRIDGSCA